MNDLTNHGVSRAFQLLWRRRPRVAAASWCKRRYGREREWRSRVGLTECGSGTSVDITYWKKRSGKHWKHWKHCRMRREEAEGQTKYRSEVCALKWLEDSGN